MRRRYASSSMKPRRCSVLGMRPSSPMARASVVGRPSRASMAARMAVKRAPLTGGLPQVPPRPCSALATARRRGSPTEAPLLLPGGGNGAKATPLASPTAKALVGRCRWSQEQVGGRVVAGKGLLAGGGDDADGAPTGAVNVGTGRHGAALYRPGPRSQEAGLPLDVGSRRRGAIPTPASKALVARGRPAPPWRSRLRDAPPARGTRRGSRRRPSARLASSRDAPAGRGARAAGARARAPSPDS